MLALTALFQSRKFLIAFIVVVVMAPLVYLGKLSVDAFVKTVETLTVALIAAIGVEGAAEKWGAPPPPAPPGRVATAADSLKPPKLPTVPPMLMLCLAALALPLAGCAWFSANKQALSPVEAAVCVFGAEEAGLSPEQSALYCKIAIDEVNSLLAQKHQKAGSFRRAADAGADGAK